MSNNYTKKISLSEDIKNIKNNTTDIYNIINKVCKNIEEADPIVKAFENEVEDSKKIRLLNDAYYSSKNDELHGVIVGVKDIFRVDGFPTKAGSSLPPELFEGQEASSVTKLKKAGALIAGKTVTTEFAYFEPGQTRNPVNINHTPGGSSSGSAAAVAAGFCHVALGTQTIGSISRPASFCGIIGYKPSYGRISTDGVIPFSPSADHVGFFTQDIEGIGIIANVLCDNWNKNIKTSKLPVLGVPDGNYMYRADNTVLENFEFNIQKLQDKGFIIKRIKTFENIEDINRIHKLMVSAEIAEVHKNWFKKHRKLYRFHTKEIIEYGQKIDKSDVKKAIKGQLELRKKLQNLMSKQKFDLWISPSTLTEAPIGIETTGNPFMNLPWTYSGLPTITIPSEKTTNQLPLGLQFTGFFNEDEKMLDFVGRIKGIEV
ncbi:MAG: hypothetical protein A2033_13060 [Bacteroidetes bacterium GWA2_31_9]|nr:MAG: hypothetical protein A2033_13060 [Bacteroidetes bacterium GWA2_31_9]